MAGRSELYRNLEQFDTKLKEYFRGKKGHVAQLRQHRKSLLRALELAQVDPALSHIASRLYGGKSLLRRILDGVEKNEIALPRAIYDHAHYGGGPRSVCSHWRCAPTDFLAAQELANQLRLPLGSFTKAHQSIERALDIGDLIDVEAAREEITVYLGQRALEDMLFAASEGYLVPRTKRMQFTEVYGLCLGTVRHEALVRRGGGEYWRRTVRVDRAATQLRAKGTGDAVTPNRKSFEVQIELARSVTPYLEVVGDFHSHAYRRAQKIRSIPGWELSERDQDYNLYWLQEMRSLGQEPRVSFVIAIGRRKRASSHRILKSPNKNVRLITIGSCTIAIAAYRILRNADYLGKGIALNLPGE